MSKKKKRKAKEAFLADKADAIKAAKKAKVSPLSLYTLTITPKLTIETTKYDPNAPKTVLQIQAAERLAATASLPSTASSALPSSNGAPQPTIQEIRERLHRKIALLQSSRPLPSSTATPSEATTTPAPPPPLKTKESLIQEAQGERLAQSKADALAKKQAKKQARKAYKQALELAQASEASDVDPLPSTSLSVPTKAAAKKAKKASSSSSTTITESAIVPSSSSTSNTVVVVVDDAPTTESDLTFSTLDFATPSAFHLKDHAGPSRPKAANHNNKDPKAALDKLQERARFLSKLSTTSRERAEEKDKWSAVTTRAEGGKVLNEEDKLKKMIKRQDKAKSKSKKVWEDRVEADAHQAAAKQKKRADNIAARNQVRKDKRLGVKKSGKHQKKATAGGEGSKFKAGKKKVNRGFEKGGGRPASRPTKGGKQ